MARPPLSLGELIEHWTLVGQEIDLVSAKRTDTRLPFALLLKFYGRHGRFPRSRGELHPDAVEFVARALKADPASVAAYDWSGRSTEWHHGQIRRHFGFRACGEAEGKKLAQFLAGDFAQRECRYDMVREQFLGERRVRQLEPPTPDQAGRYVRTALFRGARLLSARVAGRLSGQAVARLLALIGAASPAGWPVRARVPAAATGVSPGLACSWLGCATYRTGRLSKLPRSHAPNPSKPRQGTG